jgi:hypothetical protein
MCDAVRAPRFFRLSDYLERMEHDEANGLDDGQLRPFSGVLEAAIPPPSTGNLKPQLCMELLPAPKQPRGRYLPKDGATHNEWRLSVQREKRSANREAKRMQQGPYALKEKAVARRSIAIKNVFTIPEFDMETDVTPSRPAWIGSARKTEDERKVYDIEQITSHFGMHELYWNGMYDTTPCIIMACFN